MLDEKLLNRIVLLSMAEETHRSWTPEEDQFLRDHFAWMTDAEIGAQLGRSENAVHIRWSRELHLPSRSKHPDIVTPEQAAKLLGIDPHKVTYWVDMGLILGRLMPGERKIRLIDRTAFRRWVLNPRNWVYFKAERVRDPELKRMIQLRADRWGDEWWTARQVADYHGVNIHAVKAQIYRGTIKSFHLPISLGGRNHDRGWSNHFVLKSVALRAVFYTGKGAQRNAQQAKSQFTPAADAWILKAYDELGMDSVAIGRTMKIGKAVYGKGNRVIAYRYKQLKERAAKKRKPSKR